jgi:hypothetical protein
MPAAELLGLAEVVALQVFKRRADKPGPIVKTGRTGTSIDFAVVNILKKAIMRFRVVAVTRADGTEVRSEITYFQTRQEQLLGFIPTGPKILVAWGHYSAFMKTLQAAVQDADRAARASIVTAAG